AGSTALAIGLLTNVTEQRESSRVDAVETADTRWVPEGSFHSAIWSREEVAPGQHAWRGLDFGQRSDSALVSPTVTASSSRSLARTSPHRHSFESSSGTDFDGGVVEITKDGGKVWQDLAEIATIGYSGQIGDASNSARNPIGGRQGFVAKNPSWPNRDKVRVD